MTGIWAVYFGSADEVQWRRGTLVGRLTESKYYKTTFEVIGDLDWSVGVACVLQHDGKRSVKNRQGI